MERFSHAYLAAVAAAAGCKVLSWSVDDERVDATLSRRALGKKVKAPKIDIQLKSTTNPKLWAKSIRYRIDAATYDDLRENNRMTPILLVLLRMPKHPQRWLHVDERRVRMRKCAYWISLRGKPDISPKKSLTLRISRAQVFNAQALHDMMLRLEDGLLP